MARRLVRPHNYQGMRWMAFRDPFSGSLPQVPCCYCVFDTDGRLLYVGQTVNLRSRFYVHKRAGLLPPDAWIKVRCGERYGDWAMREARLINRLRPPFNLRRS